MIVGGAGVVMGGLAIDSALDASSSASDSDGDTGQWGQDQVDLEAKGERSATLGRSRLASALRRSQPAGVMFVIGGPKAVESSGVAIAPTRGGAAFSWLMCFKCSTRLQVERRERELVRRRVEDSNDSFACVVGSSDRTLVARPASVIT